MYVWYFSLMFLFVAEETERILQCNGRVFCLDDESGVHRLWLPDEESPGLAMSRAFGDYCVKDFGLISVPDVTQRHITSKDQFVVLATDGVCLAFWIVRNYRISLSRTVMFSSLIVSYFLIKHIEQK